MPEYISREDAVFKISKNIFQFDNGCDAEYAITLLFGVPAADVAGVVRCKDCVNERHCQFTQYQGEMGYCSLGERKGGEQE